VVGVGRGGGCGWDGGPPPPHSPFWQDQGPPQFPSFKWQTRSGGPPPPPPRGVPSQKSPRGAENHGIGGVRPKMPPEKKIIKKPKRGPPVPHPLVFSRVPLCPPRLWVLPSGVVGPGFWVSLWWEIAPCPPPLFFPPGKISWKKTGWGCPGGPPGAPTSPNRKPPPPLFRPWEDRSSSNPPAVTKPGSDIGSPEPPFFSRFFFRGIFRNDKPTKKNRKETHRSQKKPGGCPRGGRVFRIWPPPVKSSREKKARPPPHPPLKGFGPPPPCPGPPPPPSAPGGAPEPGGGPEMVGFLIRNARPQTSPPDPLPKTDQVFSWGWLFSAPPPRNSRPPPML